MTTEQEQMVIKNINLVYQILINNLNILPYEDKFEDLASIGKIGLIKAALNFDETKGNKFSSFAAPCIVNEIKMNFRVENRKPKVISLQQNITDEGKETLEEILEDKTTNIERKIILQEELTEVLNIIFNCFKERDTIVLLYFIAGVTQREIGEFFGLSRSSIEKIERLSVKKIRKIMNEKSIYTKRILVIKKGEAYYINFIQRDIKSWNITLSEIHLRIKDKLLSHFDINYYDNKVSIKIPLDTEEFFILAQIFEVIYRNATNLE